MNKIKANFFKTNLATKIFATFLVLVIFIQLVNFAVSLNEQQKRLEDNLISTNIILAGLAAHRIKAGYLNNQWPLHYLAQLKKSSDIIYWQIIKPDGIIYQADDQKMWGKKITDTSWLGRTGVFNSTSLETGEPIKVITQPIAIDGSVWTFSLGISLKEIISAQKALATFYFYLYFYFIILASLLTYVLTRIIVSPIKSLTLAVRKIVQTGDLSQTVKIEARDEIGVLTDSFNKMINSLRIKQAKLLDAQKKESEARKKLEVIMHSMGDGVFVTDIKKRIILFNEVAERMTGWRFNEVEGKFCADVFKMTDKDGQTDICKTDCPLDKVFKTGKIVPLKNDVCLTSKDGRKIPVADSSAPFRDNKGEIIGGVTIFRDVTREKEIDRAKTELISLASHQLRTPLSTVNWYTEMLLSANGSKLLNKKQREYLKEVYRGSQRMVSLVNALLNVSRIEMGTLAIKPSPTDIIKLAKSNLSNFELQIKRKKIKIEKHYDKLGDINVDPNLTSVVFQNLLSNAVKYTPTGGKICLSIIKRKSDILISVADTGYGIPKNQQSKIFTKLFRADNIKEKDTEGTGLGLYIVKSIIDQSGGKIWFESEENKGTTFYISLPLSGMKERKGTKGLVYSG